MSLSNWLEIEIMNHIFGKVPYNPSVLALGLGVATSDSAPNELAEINNYSRLILSSAYWTSAANGRIVNALGFVFPQAIGGDWGVVTHFLIFNSGTYGLGQMLLYGHIVSEWDIKEDDIPQFLAGELEITLD